MTLGRGPAASGQLCGVPEPDPLHVVITDLDDLLGPERDE